MALHQHGDQDALDDDTHDRLNAGQLGLDGVKGELCEEGAPVDGVEADL